MHKFYVSLTEIHIKPETGTIEISMRIFPDDLDFALKNLNGKNPQIASSIEIEEAETWLKDYLNENFSISINEEEVSYSLLGKMIDGDAMICFLEAAYGNFPKTVSIHNSTLCDFFKDQKNIVQIYYGEQNKSMLLSKSRNEGSVNFSPLKPE